MGLKIIGAPTGHAVLVRHTGSQIVASSNKTSLANTEFFNVGEHGGFKRFSLYVDVQSTSGTTFSVFWRTGISVNADQTINTIDPLDPAFWTAITIGAAATTTTFWYTSDDENNVDASEGTTFSALGILCAPYLGIGFENTGAQSMIIQMSMFIGELR